MLTPFRSSSLVLVMISSKSVHFCNCFHARRANSRKITILTGYLYLMPACAGLLKPRGSRLELLKSAFNAKNMQIVLVYLQLFCRNSLLKYLPQPKIVKKFTENLFLGSSWSFKVIDVNKSKKNRRQSCYDKQHVCTYLQPFSRYTSQ